MKHPAIAAPVSRTAPSYTTSTTNSSKGARNRNYNQSKRTFSFGKKKADVSESAFASAAPVPVNTSSRVAPSTPSFSGSTPSFKNTSSNSGGGDIAQINQSISRLRADLDSSAGDRQKINSVVAESKTLLSQIEAMRGSDTSSMTGELGDTWWNVIKLKTDAVKLSRE